MRRIALTIALAGALATALASGASRAGNDRPYPGTEVVATRYAFADLKTRLDRAVEANGFAVVTQASASRGAAARNITIPGNIVLGVFRNDYAVRMLEASVAAGIEAPLRFYLTENADGTATLTYRNPTAVFAPYQSPALDAMAAELDEIWARIAAQAVGQ